MEYANVQRNREAAIRAPAAMSPKPIRIMGPADYKPKDMKPIRDYEETKHDEAKEARKLLSARCVKLLQDGALTTIEIAAQLKVGQRLVACALREIAGIERQDTLGKRVPGKRYVPRSVLWMMPVRGHAIKGNS